jgi:N-6 DNA Methylase
MSYGNYRSIIESIARTRSSQVQIFADFCRMSACALSLNTREGEYLEISQRYNRDELSEFSQALAYLIEEMEAKPFTDILGDFYLEVASHSSKQARGEFFTPPQISKLMARMLFDVEAVKAKGMPITVNEPACGSGGMVLAVAELFAPDAVDLLRVTCQDINPLAADMCFINTTLWGIPAQVILGDTIRMTETARWKNLHWRRVGEDQRLAFRELMEFISSPPKQQSFTDRAAESRPEAFREVNGQFELDLGSSRQQGASR